MGRKMFKTGTYPFSCKFCLRTFSDLTRYCHHEKRHNNRYLKHWLRKKSRTAKRLNTKKKQTFEEPVFQQKWYMLMESGIKVKTITVSEQLGTHYSCGLCNRAFSAEIHLTRHERQAHSRGADPDTPTVDKKRFRCKYCDKTHHNRADLDYHERSHTGETVIYTCEVCKATFKRKVYLNRHMRIHNDVRPYVCKVCGKSFIKGGGLKEHERTHTGEKPYKCSTCLRGFSGRANLRRHEMTHSGEQPFECEVCGKRCNRIASLRQHMRIHTGERPYNCMHCNKSFPTCANLRRHERTHLEKKQFSCRQCGKDFVQKYTLKLHEMNHLGIRPHLCLLCGKTFMEKRKLRQHLTSGHGIVQTDDSENGSQQYELDLATIEGKSSINNIPESLRSNAMAAIEGAHFKTLEDFQAYWKAAYLENGPEDVGGGSGISESDLSDHMAKQVDSANKLQQILLKNLPQDCMPNLSQNQQPDVMAQLPLIPPDKLPEALIELARIDAAKQAEKEVAKQAAKGAKKSSKQTALNRVVDSLHVKRDSNGNGVSARLHVSHDLNDKSQPSKRRKMMPSYVETQDEHHDRSWTEDYNDTSRNRVQVEMVSQNGNSIFNRFNDMAGAGAFNCRQCGQAFTSQIVLEIHLKTHKQEECQSFCIQCNRSFSNILDLEDHIKSHDIPGSDLKKVSNDVFAEPDEYKSFCAQCDKTFDCIQDLEAHVQTHDVLLRQSASERSSDSIPNHVVSSSGVSSAPDDSDCIIEASETSTGSIMIQKSVPKISGGKKLKVKKVKIHTCPHCNKEYKKKRSLKHHLLTQHDFGIVPVKCVANVDNEVYSVADMPSVADESDVVPKSLENVEDSEDVAYESCDPIDAQGEPDLMILKGGSDEESFQLNMGEEYMTTSPMHANTDVFNSSQSPRKIWACKVCNQTFPIQQLLAGHMNKHRHSKASRVEEEDDGEEKPFSCAICSKAFSKQERLAGHMNKHKDHVVKIPTEMEAVENMEVLNRDVPNNPGSKWRCPYCDNKFDERDAVVEHLHEHTTSQSAFTCEVCRKGFNKKANYTAHLITHTTELKHQCEVCNKMFKHLQSLRKHVIRCRTIFQCELCVESFTHKRLLNSHMWNTHHREDTCKCKICGKVMSSASGLREHELIHSGEKPYKCKICERGFVNRSNLRRHVMIHEDERPFKCNFCKMTFNRLASLQQHERCHTGEKPYKCTICGLLFTSKSTRRKHERRHSKQKDIKCKYCDKTFWDNYSCHSHERVHTGDLPFECVLCNKKYPERNNLTKHMKGNHKEWYAINIEKKGAGNESMDGESPGHSDEDDDRELQPIKVQDACLLEPLSDDDDDEQQLQPLSDDSDDGEEEGYNMSLDTDDEEPEMSPINLDNVEEEGMEDVAEKGQEIVV